MLWGPSFCSLGWRMVHIKVGNALVDLCGVRRVMATKQRHKP
jgi:hypothetical protein